jgi:hypothetical protein
MAVEYVNRQGDRYYVLQGTTRTGKPKYYAARKLNNGLLVERMPEGYEIYEHPERGLVSVRKIRSSRVLPVERERLMRWTRELAEIDFFCVDVQGDSLVIYTPGSDFNATVEMFTREFGAFPGRRASIREYLGSRAAYTAMFRFTLVDEERRLFSLERWCFLGSIDRWWPLTPGQPLEVLAKKYLPHLNRESSYELM